MGLMKEEDAKEKFCGNLSEKSYNRMFWTLLIIIIIFSSWGGIGQGVFYMHLLTIEKEHENFDWEQASNWLLTS